MRKKTPRRQLDDAAILERLQSILVNAAEGQRSIVDDREYTGLRREFWTRKQPRPRVVSTHPTVDSFAAFIRQIADRRERVAMVRAGFKPPFEPIRKPVEPAISADAWTGPKRPVERLQAARTLLPLAQVAGESMIATLAEQNPNGAPLLEGREEALQHLRNLHQILGELLSAIDRGHFDDEMGQDLAAKAARHAKRVARALRDDPMPYVSSALLLGLFTACGLPGIGGYMADVALNVGKHLGRRAD